MQRRGDSTLAAPSSYRVGGMAAVPNAARCSRSDRVSSGATDHWCFGTRRSAVAFHSVLICQPSTGQDWSAVCYLDKMASLYRISDLPIDPSPVCSRDLGARLAMDCCIRRAAHESHRGRNWTANARWPYRTGTRKACRLRAAGRGVKRHLVRPRLRLHAAIACGEPVEPDFAAKRGIVTCSDTDTDTGSGEGAGIAGIMFIPGIWTVTTGAGSASGRAAGGAGVCTGGCIIASSVAGCALRARRARGAGGRTPDSLKVPMRLTEARPCLARNLRTRSVLDMGRCGISIMPRSSVDRRRQLSGPSRILRLRGRKR